MKDRRREWGERRKRREEKRRKKGGERESRLREGKTKRERDME